MNFSLSIKRISAMVLRYSYLLRASRLRILDMVYWPALQLLTWGFLQTYLVKAGALNIGVCGHDGQSREGCRGSDSGRPALAIIP